MVHRSLGILMLVAAAGLAQTGALPAGQMGRVEGTVYDGDSDLPVRGAKIYASWLRQDAETDAQGRFAFKDVPSGAHSVSVSGTGAIHADATRAVTVMAGALTDHVDFRIWLPGKISGTIRDPEGGAVPGATVILAERQYVGDVSLYETIRSVVTDDLGRYHFASVWPGREFLVLARVVPEVDGAQRRIAVNQRVPVLAPTWYGGGATPDGAARVKLQSGREAQGVDIQLRESGALCVSGRLTLFGRPSRVEFALSDEGIHDVPIGGGVLPGRTGMTSESGEFAVCGLYAGRFRLEAMRLGPGRNPDAYGSKSFGLRDADEADLLLDARPLIELNGSISLDGSAPEAEALAHVYLWSLDRSRRSAGMEERATGLAVRSTFAIKTTAETSFVPSVAVGVSKNVYVRQVRYHGVEVTNRAFIPAAGPGLEIVLGNDGGSVNTVVADEKGRLISGAVVVLIPAGMRSPAELNAMAKTGIADGAGRCGFTNLRPGRYFALATADAVASPGGYSLRPGQTIFPNVLEELFAAAGRGAEVTVNARQESSVTLAPVAILQRGR